MRKKRFSWAGERGCMGTNQIQANVCYQPTLLNEEGNLLLQGAFESYITSSHLLLTTEL